MYIYIKMFTQAREVSVHISGDVSVFTDLIHRLFALRLIYLFSLPCTFTFELRVHMCILLH